MSLPGGGEIRSFSSTPEESWGFAGERVLHWSPISEQSPAAPEADAGKAWRLWKVRGWTEGEEEFQDVWVYDGVGQTAGVSMEKGYMYAKGRTVYFRDLTVADAPKVEVATYERDVRQISDGGGGFFSVRDETNDRLDLWFLAETGPRRAGSVPGYGSIERDGWGLLRGVDLGEAVDRLPESSWLSSFRGTSFWMRDLGVPLEAAPIKLDDPAGMSPVRSAGRDRTLRWVAGELGGNRVLFWPLAGRWPSVLSQDGVVRDLAFARDAEALLSCASTGFGGAGRGVQSWPLVPGDSGNRWGPEPGTAHPVGYGCFSFDTDPTSGRIAWSSGKGTHGVLAREGKPIPFDKEDPVLYLRPGGPVAYDPRGGRFAVASAKPPADLGSILRVYDLTSEDPPLSAPRFRDYESAGGNPAADARTGPDAVPRAAL